jgi:hypothetical protein
VSAWQLDHDVVALGPLRLAVQRIARSHWRPDGALRSWGLAPLHREGEALLVPCAEDEALWLGAWLEDDMAGATLRVADPATGASETAELPRDFQLTSLRGPGGTQLPLSLPHGGRRVLRLEFGHDRARAALELVLLGPAGWAARTHRPAPAPLDKPPPLPPLLG